MERNEEKMVKATILLKRLFEKNRDEMDQVGLLIQRDGIIDFLKDLDKYEISSDLYEKLYAVKVIVLTLEDLEGSKRKDV